MTFEEFQKRLIITTNRGMRAMEKMTTEWVMEKMTMEWGELAEEAQKAGIPDSVVEAALVVEAFKLKRKEQELSA